MSNYTSEQKAKELISELHDQFYFNLQTIDVGGEYTEKQINNFVRWSISAMKECAKKKTHQSVPTTMEHKEFYDLCEIELKGMI